MAFAATAWALLTIQVHSSFVIRPGSNHVLLEAAWRGVKDGQSMSVKRQTQGRPRSPLIGRSYTLYLLLHRRAHSHTPVCCNGKNPAPALGAHQRVSACQRSRCARSSPDASCPSSGPCTCCEWAPVTPPARCPPCPAPPCCPKETAPRRCLTCCRCAQRLSYKTPSFLGLRLGAAARQESDLLASTFGRRGRAAAGLRSKWRARGSHARGSREAREGVLGVPLNIYNVRARHVRLAARSTTSLGAASHFSC